MVVHWRRSFVIVAVGAAVVAAGCDRAPARSPTGVTTTSARPDARPAPVRTVDNTGFVDNAGRSSNERARTELSGMRATETGTEVPTGTPGSGLPLPIEPSAPAEGDERPPEEGASSTGAPAEAVVGRAAQALCDYAMSCGRVGKGAEWPSLAACTGKVRASVRGDLSQAGCPLAFDATAVASCLSAIRLAPCDQRIERLGTLNACEPATLCVDR